MSSAVPVDYLESLKALAKAKGFLGREFLTWLWYRIEKNDGFFNLKSGKQVLKVRAWVDDRIVFEAAHHPTHRYTLKGGDPAKSIEAAASIRSGKLVREFKVGFEINGVGPFYSVLGSDGSAANGLSPRSLVLPAITSERDNDEDLGDEPLLARVEQTQLFFKVLDSLFRSFLDERIDDAWSSGEAKDIQSWLKNHKISVDSSLH